MSDARAGAIFKVGDLLNNTYRIEAVLGRGGTSEVYQARSEISGHHVALKALRSEFSDNEDFLNLMKREEEIREIRHDAIVRYFHNQRTADGVVFLVMDYIEGPGLDKKLKEGGMSAPDLLIVAGRVAEGLNAAHSKNIVHRDLSPDNIILRSGNPADAVIIDFGIAKDSNPGAETVVGNEFAGKYAYAAPEQLAGKSDPRTDIYALGALLLATFRGASPSAGKNPLEVIEAKSAALDTGGVPAPLGALIDKMTAVDPQDRFQSAGELLAAIRGNVSAEDQSDATVIAPLSQKRPSPTAQHAPKLEQKSGRGALIPILSLLVLLAAGGGAYVSGFLDRIISRTPVADPYLLVIERPAGQAPRALGHVPNEDMAATLTSQIVDAGGAADLALARGDLVSEWPEEVMRLVDLVAPLPAWQIDVVGNDVTITGMTEDRVEHAALNGVTLEGPLSGTIAVELGPRILSADRVMPILQGFSDCGDLRLFDPPPTGYPNGAEVVIQGKVASATTRVELTDALLSVAGNRRVSVEVEELNPTLCLIDQALPEAPPGGFTIGFGNGDTGARNPSGRFIVGQNPVIDVTIPAEITGGYVYVSALDVSGNVFHLMPNVYAEDNSVTSIRDGVDGPVMIRVAHSIEDRDKADGEMLAFQVDDTVLGKTEIVVIHSHEEILDGMRPITESAQGFVQALQERSEPVRSLDSRILETTLP